MVEPISKNYIDNSSPVNGRVFSQIPDSDSTDIDNAVSAAKDAFQSWSKITKKDRYDHIMRLADEIEYHFDELVEAESKDNGKPEWLAKAVDIPRASENFRFFATASLHPHYNGHTKARASMESLGEWLLIGNYNFKILYSEKISFNKQLEIFLG